MKKQILGLAAGIAMLVPTAARADLICAAGSISYYACASITVSFVDLGAGVGGIQVDVANLDAWTNNTFTGAAVDGYRLTAFGILGSPTLTGTVTGLSSVDYTNATSTNGNLAGLWTYTTSFSGINVQAGAAISGTSGGLTGCLPDGANGSYAQTCNPNPNSVTDFVSFTFSTNTTLAQLQALYPTNNWGYAMRGQSGNVDDSESYRCDDVQATTNAQDCLVTRITTTETVPEPMTMILLGTGLAGLGAARRRKKNGDVASE